MTIFRQKINSIVINRNNNPAPNKTTDSIFSIFGNCVFNDDIMKKKLKLKTYTKLKETLEKGLPLEADIIEILAKAMKEWALEQGVTHFTHWFQPMTESTAEKHDSFLIQQEGKALLQFSSKELMQGEPDASSFPSGGLRATFEARGYTVWDPTFPAFIKKSKNAGTLCIPTVFVSYTGEALDRKIPLLRSQKALSKSAVHLLNLLGKTNINKVHTNVGLEQEFFLIDSEYFAQRPDLIASGRTLFGNAPYKGQDLNDHYFGSINERILSFMEECELELYQLGIPAKTRHNEVAPSQFEIAPVYEEANLSISHNLLLMEVLNKIAVRHNFKLLLHEKPFANMNGSGKHNNWSMEDSDGNNLLQPGKTEDQNLQFLLFLAATIRAIDKYSDLLRLSVATPGNDFRLGGHEAPPAIMSVFLGETLSKIVNTFITGEKHTDQTDKHINFGISSLPSLPKDNSDRNRTSSFAFTGNKFEFRAVGSNQNPSSSNHILSTAVAESLDYISSQLESKFSAKINRKQAIEQIIQEIFTKHSRIIYDGDGYSKEWEEKAEQRGLPNLRTTVDAVKACINSNNTALLEKYNVLNKNEIQARLDIKLEHYININDIELKALLDIAKTMILPAANKHQTQLAASINATASALGDTQLDQQKKLLQKFKEDIDKFIQIINLLEIKTNTKKIEDDLLTQAEYYQNSLLPLMNQLRELINQFEANVEDDLWPLPKYREILSLQ